MQVNRVQSPSFGRLFIDRDAREKLKQLPHRTQLDLQKAKKDLAKTKFYHIYIGEDLKVKMVSTSGAYWGIFNNKDYDTRYTSYKIKNILRIPENSRNTIFGQYDIVKGKKEELYTYKEKSNDLQNKKVKLTSYIISGNNKMEDRQEILDSIEDDLGILTTLALDFDKAARMESQGIVIHKTPQQVQERINNEINDLMNSCSIMKIKEI